MHFLLSVLIKLMIRSVTSINRRYKLKDFPLFGIPVGVKDLNDIKDVKTTQGSHIYENFIPEEDDNIVSSMRSNGAIFPGKTNVPEHGFGATTTNDLFGTTNNPYDVQKVVELQVEGRQSR